jgi:hypothetical protein
MSPKAELVRQISAEAFTDAIDLMACLAVLREGKSLVVPRALDAANASLAATIVQKALLQRVLMTVERAFAPVNRLKSDRHARWPLRTCRTRTYLMKSRMLDRENIFSRRAIPGATTMQTSDAKNSITIVTRSWRIRLCEIRPYQRPSLMTCVTTR